MSNKFIFIILVIFAAMAVAIGDVLLKKSSAYNYFSDFLKSPWMIGAILLYAFNIIIFSYLFFVGMKLVEVGIVQLVLYAIIVLFSGMLFFHETLTLIQFIGIAMGILGVILMNL